MPGTHAQSPIVQVLVDEAYRPSWYRDAYPAHIPLPGLPARALPGHPIVLGRDEQGTVPLVSMDGDSIHTQFDWETWRTFVLEERYRAQRRPLYTRLPFHYHRVPGLIRQLAASITVRRQSASGIPRREFPGFPIEQGFELLQHVVGVAGRGSESAPSSRSTTLLSHDIDTGSGFTWVEPTASLEMAFNQRSIWYVVGCRYNIDYGILDWLVENGFEIGLHGFNHDNRLAFLRPADIRRRIDRCLPLMQRYGIRRFRSPSWFRNRRLYSVLRDYFQEDQSCLDTDISCPGGPGGCLTNKPFTIDGLKHVPLTVPYEVPGFFGYPPERWLAFWKPKIEWLRDCGGLVSINTHTDPHRSGNAGAIKAYESLLVHLTTTAKTKAQVTAGGASASAADTTTPVPVHHESP